VRLKDSPEINFFLHSRFFTVLQNKYSELRWQRPEEDSGELVASNKFKRQRKMNCERVHAKKKKKKKIKILKIGHYFTKIKNNSSGRSINLNLVCVLWSQNFL